MEDVHERPVLRALAIGEIFDRAVTMYVRNFVVFTLIVATLLVPIGILQFIYTDRAGDSFTQLIRQIQHPGSAPAYDGSALLGLLSVALLVLLLAPFTNNAVAVGVAALYAGRKPTYRDGFARVLTRWAPLLGTSVLSLLVLVGTYFIIVFALVILVFIGVLAARGSAALSVTFVIVGLVLTLAALTLFLVLVITCGFALYATTIEASAPADAIGEAFRRIFNRREFRKAMLIALAYLALEIGVLLLSGTIGGFLGFYVRNITAQAAIQVVVGTTLNAMFTAFLTVLLAVYYYDVRTRAEGLDLEVALDDLTAPA